MAKRALIFLYPKADEGEVCVPYAVLKRGGVHCTLAGPTTEPIACSVGVRIIPEMTVLEASKKGPYDVIVIPGGRWGWQALCDDKIAVGLLREQERDGRLIAAICTATIVMKFHGIMFGRNLTSYPSLEGIMRQGDCYNFKYDDIVIDRNLITSTGQITTFNWAVKVLEYVTDRETAARVAQEVLLPY